MKGNEEHAGHEGQQYFEKFWQKILRQTLGNIYTKILILKHCTVGKCVAKFGPS